MEQETCNIALHTAYAFATFMNECGDNITCKKNVLNIFDYCEDNLICFLKTMAEFEIETLSK